MPPSTLNPQSLKIVFAGTPGFAVPALQSLLDSSHDVVAVYTQPDRPAGRGRKQQASPVKQCAQAANIPVFQPVSLRSDEEQKKLRALQPDLLIVVAYGLLLPTAILEVPTLGALNIHASLLPRWRGAAPIQYAIWQGDTETGISLMQITEALDAGPVFAQTRCPIHATDTSANIHDRLAKIGAKTLLEQLPQIAAKAALPTPQDSSLVCFAPKIKKEQGKIDWEHAAEQLDQQIRAFNPWPVAFCELPESRQRLRIWRATPEAPPQNNTTQPGTIIEANAEGIVVATGEGVLRLHDIQLPGGKPLSAAAMLNARAEQFQPGQRLL